MRRPMLLNMKNLRNKLLIAGFACAALVAAIFGFAQYSSAHPSTVISQTTAVATTTVAYISPALGDATYIYQFDNPTFSSGKITNVSTVDATSLYLQAAASSSASVITVTPQWSNNNIDWYNLGSTGTASALGIITTASTTIYSWQVGTTSTTSIVLSLPAVPAFHERVVFATSAGSSSIYAEVDLKQNPATP